MANKNDDYGMTPEQEQYFQDSLLKMQANRGGRDAFVNQKEIDAAYKKRQAELEQERNAEQPNQESESIDVIESQDESFEEKIQTNADEQHEEDDNEQLDNDVEQPDLDAISQEQTEQKSEVSNDSTSADSIKSNPESDINKESDVQKQTSDEIVQEETPVPKQEPSVLENKSEAATLLQPSPLENKDWLELGDMFQKNGDTSEIVYNNKLDVVGISRIPESLIGSIQRTLLHDYDGEVITFPWGDYTITNKSKVFDRPASVSRYLYYMALGDTYAETYAKQVLISTFDTIFEPDFDILTEVKNPHDQLDVYALVFATVRRNQQVVSTTKSVKQPVQESKITSSSELQELRKLLQTAFATIRNQNDKLLTMHQALIEKQEMNNTTMNALLLERMALLKDRDGKPLQLTRDLQDLIGGLEASRDTIYKLDETIQGHVAAERSRKLRLVKEREMIKRRDAVMRVQNKTNERRD